MEKYFSFFSGTDLAKNYECTLQVKNNKEPVFMKTRNIPLSLKENVKRELDLLVEKRIIHPVKTVKWAAPLVIAFKRNGGLRLCGDYSALNNALLEEKFSLSNIEETLPSLQSEIKYFAKLDMSNAFYQLSLSEEFKSLTTCNTEFGLFCYERTPFGIRNAPSCFQNYITTITKNLKGTVSTWMTYSSMILLYKSLSIDLMLALYFFLKRICVLTKKNSVFLLKVQLFLDIKSRPMESSPILPKSKLFIT